MPIEIKELRIKAVVAPPRSDQHNTSDYLSVEKLKKEILRECLREVKSYINEQKER